MGPVERLLPTAPVATLDDHLARGGGAGLVGARHVGPEETAEVLAASGLRGRGGAGFPAATKWRSVASAESDTRYVVANGAEGEPGTFKDRTLLRTNPYAVVEGMLVACEAVGARRAFLALKASSTTELAAVRRALAEVADAGWLQDVDVQIVTGPEEYLFGEEKGAARGGRGARAAPPPAPALRARAVHHRPCARLAGHRGGGWGRAHRQPDAGEQRGETLAHAAWILAHGSDEFRALGTACTPGTVLCTVVGDVERAGVWEVPAGTPLREVLGLAGAPREGRRLKAAFSGVSNAVITDALADTPLCFDAMTAAGIGLGSAGFVVYDDTACMVEVATVLSRFLSVESCGQCPPCKLGTGQITSSLDEIRTGAGEDATLGTIEESLRTVADGNRCYVPVQERVMISSILRAYPEDVAAHLEGRCPSSRRSIPTREDRRPGRRRGRLRRAPGAQTPGTGPTRAEPPRL